jgi:hypothetical protein
MQAGASGRLETAEIEAQKKQDSSDFALWKSAKPENLLGIHLGEKVAPDGTSNVRRWCAIAWAKQLTFTAAVPI